MYRPHSACLGAAFARLYCGTGPAARGSRLAGGGFLFWLPIRDTPPLRLWTHGVVVRIARGRLSRAGGPRSTRVAGGCRQARHGRVPLGVRPWACCAACRVSSASPRLKPCLPCSALCAFLPFCGLSCASRGVCCCSAGDESPPQCPDAPCLALPLPPPSRRPRGFVPHPPEADAVQLSCLPPAQTPRRRTPLQQTTRRRPPPLCVGI